MRTAWALAVMVGMGGAAWADAPDVGEVLSLARQSAVEAGSRHLMVEVARLSDRREPERALADYRSAAELEPPAEQGGVLALASDLEVAQGLAANGDVQAAVTLIRSGLTRPLTPAMPSPEHDSIGPRVQALSLIAEMLTPSDGEGAAAALDEARQVLEEIGDTSARGRALTPYLRAMSLSDPAQALTLAQQALDGGLWRMIPIEVIVNAAIADPALVLAQADALLKTGRVYFRRGPSPDLVRAMLVAFVLPDDAVRALDLATGWKLERTPDLRQIPPLEPLAEAMLAVGLEGLPRDGAYAKLYARVARDLSRLDYEAAAGFALSLEKPSERGAALSRICEALAVTDPAQAVDAASRLIELCDTEGGCRNDSIRRAAEALAALDSDTAGELMLRFTQLWSVMEPFPALWRADREAAEALLDRMRTPMHFFALLSVLKDCADTLAEGEGRTLAAMALALPVSDLDERTAWWIVGIIAPHAPDFARERWAWADLSPVDPTTAKPMVITAALDALIATGEACVTQQQGEPGEEVAEIERIIAGAPADADWPWLYRARLAGLYGLYDSTNCISMADGLLAALEGAPAEVRRTQVLSALAVALARVDLARAEALLSERAELHAQATTLMRVLADVASEAPADGPGLVARVVGDLGARTVGDEYAWGPQKRVLQLLARNAPAADVMAYVTAWLDGAQDRPSTCRLAVEAVRYHERPELAPHVITELTANTQDPSAAAAIAEGAGTALAGVPEETLRTLLERVRQLPEADATPASPWLIAAPALPWLVAALAARDWAAGQELLDSLAPGARTRSLLHVPGMIGMR